MDINLKDITTRKDIELLVNSFYNAVRKDGAIGFIFNDIMEMNWEKHIPIMVDFWETILLDTASYTKNAMAVHFEVNKKIKLEAAHFQRWLFLFNKTTDENFAGEKALLAKKRALSVAQVMQLKMEQQNIGLNISNQKK